MKLIDLLGLTKIEHTNSFLSITESVLFVSSHNTEKSMRPLLFLTSLRKGSTAALNCALVNASLNSKSCALAAVAIAFSRTMNNLLTLILSNAEGVDNAVLSPKSSVPWPGNVTIGLTLALYKSSLEDCEGLMRV